MRKIYYDDYFEYLDALSYASGLGIKNKRLCIGRLIHSSDGNNFDFNGDNFVGIIQIPRIPTFPTFPKNSTDSNYSVGFAPTSGVQNQ